MRKFLEKIILYLYRTRRRKMFNNYFLKVLKNSNSELSLDNEEMCSWIKRWSVFGWTPNKNGYKAFYPYIGSDFVPNEIARCFIEPILTPEEYQPFYNDKNSLAMFMNKEWLPKTYFRSMDGKIYDGDYNTVLKDRFVDLFKGVDELVVKPAKDMGGRGVTLFCRRGNDFVDDKKNVLSLEYLQNVYKTNFLIQERLTQSSFFSRFNESSVNTLRIATYRNVTSGEISVIGAVIRIGGKGSFVDNACSGGSFVGVDMNGKLSNFACDEYGVKRSVYNGIDFSKEEFIIPNWDKIKIFVIDVARKMPHMSLFANDVAIDKDGNPRLIEVNTIQFSYWFYNLTGRSIWGEHTEELLKYCLCENKKIRPSLFLKYN